MRATLLALLFLASASAFAVCSSLTAFAPREYPIPAVDVHDVDGDGNLDLLGKREIAYGRADGTFEPVVSLGLPQSKFASRALDMDGDGRDDILFSGAAILPNNGNRTFGPPVVPVSGVVAAIGDLTNDGRPDIVIAEGSGTLTMINEGGFRFHQQRSAFPISGGRVLDADGDGNADIVAFKDKVIVQRGDGKGGFLDSYEFGPVASLSTFGDLTDMNGDQKPDLIVIHSNRPIAIYYAPFRDTSTPAEEIATSSGLAVVAADFDGNGFKDLALAQWGRVAIYLNDGRGNFRVSQLFSTTEFDYRIAAADFNRDGMLDLVIPDSLVASGIVFGNGDGTFRLTPTLRLLGEGTQSQVVTSGDFDGDGIDELISVSNWGGLFAGHQVEPYAYDFERLPLRNLVLLPFFTRRIAVGDIDQDSGQELVVADGTSIDVFSRNNGKWIAHEPYLTGSAVAGVAVIDHRIAFINGDGYLNIMTLGGNPSVVAPILPLGNYSRIIRAADLDRNGREDLVIASSAGIYAVYARGDGLFEPPLKLHDANAWDMVTGDFNGDKNADIAFSLGWITLLSGNGNRTFTPIPDAIQRVTTSLAARDVDGDGITDLAVNGDKHEDWGLLVYSGESRGLSLFRGTSNGFVQTGWFTGEVSMFHPPVFARLRRGALPALLTSRYQPGIPAVVELTCGTRRQTVRH